MTRRRTNSYSRGPFSPVGDVMPDPGVRRQRADDVAPTSRAGVEPGPAFARAGFRPGAPEGGGACQSGSAVHASAVPRTSKQYQRP